MSLTNKRIAFVEEYLRCWNAAESARRVKYKQPHSQGPRLLANVEVQAYIQARLADVAMSANEVLGRLAAMAQADSRDLITLRALELLGKHHKLFTERHEVEATHTVSDDVLDAITGSLKRGYEHDLLLDEDEIE
ncbi:MAG: terminase small subunit [Zetaproteobacteria bacterium]|nr:terminase small subunit [Zetaproteobacteria bacterium]